MKKSIALLITILFTSVISILFFKNIGNTSTYVNETNKETSLVQSILLINSFKNELVPYFKSDEVYDLFLNSDLNCKELPLIIKESNISIKICGYTNKININDAQNQNNMKIFLESNDINYYIFSEFIKNNKVDEIDNSKQLYSILDSYAKEVKLNNSDILKGNFSTFEIDKNSKFLKCEINFSNNVYSHLSSFIIDIKNNKVSDFEFSFK